MCSMVKRCHGQTSVVDIMVLSYVYNNNLVWQQKYSYLDNIRFHEELAATHISINIYIYIYIYIYI